MEQTWGQLGSCLTAQAPLIMAGGRSFSLTLAYLICTPLGRCPLRVVCDCATTPALIGWLHIDPPKDGIAALCLAAGLLHCDCIEVCI